MEVSFSDLKEKEIVNIYDGKKLGHIIDILFDNESGAVRGIVVPGERKIFKRSDDIFIPLGRLKKIGDDVILVGLNLGGVFSNNLQNKPSNMRYEMASMQNYYNQPEKSPSYKNKSQSQSNSSSRQSYVRFKRLNPRKYK